MQATVQQNCPADSQRYKYSPDDIPTHESQGLFFWKMIGTDRIDIGILYPPTLSNRQGSGRSATQGVHHHCTRYQVQTPGLPGAARPECQAIGYGCAAAVAW